MTSSAGESLNLQAVHFQMAHHKSVFPLFQCPKVPPVGGSVLPGLTCVVSAHRRLFLLCFTTFITQEDLLSMLISFLCCLQQKAKEMLTESNIPHGSCAICLYDFQVGLSPQSTHRFTSTFQQKCLICRQKRESDILRPFFPIRWFRRGRRSPRPAATITSTATAWAATPATRRASSARGRRSWRRTRPGPGWTPRS